MNYLEQQTAKQSPNHSIKLSLLSLINSRTLKHRKEWEEPQEHERLQVKHDINGILEPWKRRINNRPGSNKPGNNTGPRAFISTIPRRIPYLWCPHLCCCRHQATFITHQQISHAQGFKHLPWDVLILQQGLSPLLIPLPVTSTTTPSQHPTYPVQPSASVSVWESSECPPRKRHRAPAQTPVHWTVWTCRWTWRVPQQWAEPPAATSLSAGEQTQQRQAPPSFWIHPHNCIIPLLTCFLYMHCLFPQVWPPSLKPCRGPLPFPPAWRAVKRAGWREWQRIWSSCSCKDQNTLSDSFNVVLPIKVLLGTFTHFYIATSKLSQTLHTDPITKHLFKKQTLTKHPSNPTRGSQGTWCLYSQGDSDIQEAPVTQPNIQGSWQS